MRIGHHHVGGMYLLAIALLIALAAVAAYSAQTLPVALVVSVATCMAADLLLGSARKHKPRIPASAAITGLIIGSVAPINAPVALVVLASLVAEIAKFFVKAKGRNIFNPAALGLLVALPLFGLRDEWWAAPSIHAFGVAVPLAAILVVSAYQARRLGAGLAAAVVAAVGLLAMSGTISLGGAAISLLSVNYYFAFLMVADPKTSPNRVAGQLVYGAGVATLTLLVLAAHMPYPLLVGLVMANVAYAAFRVLHNRGPVAHSPSQV